MFADLPAEIVATDPQVIAGFAHDESRLTPRAAPMAVLSPRSTEEVAACVRAVAAAGLSLVTRGAGSGLSGGANVRVGGVVLSTRRLDQIVQIDPAERLAVVQPGVITGDLRAAAHEQGLFFPPDPGSVDFCTIGGNVATDAGGMCCVKYGVTGDYVLGLEAVLADGRVLRTGRRTVKGVAGLDLTSLLVGSEGTLAVITEITVRLLPRPAAAGTLVATFPDQPSAGRAVAGLTERALDLSLLELMDRTTLAAVDDLTGMGLAAEAMLLLQCDAPDRASTLELAETICRGHGAVDVAASDDPDEGHQLLEARRQALPALERLGDWLLDDVCVPRSKVVDLIERVQQIAIEEDLTIGVFGHAGDGNMHPTIIFDAADDTSVAAARRAFDAITRHTLDLGGTITGEHGVGRLKTEWLATEVGQTSLDVQRAIKQALDPTGLLNPHAVLRAGPASPHRPQ